MAKPAKKGKFTFKIVQEGISFERTLSKVDRSDLSVILKQVKGELMRLMLLRLKTKQQCGIKLNKPIGFIFKVGRRSINTMRIADELNIRLTVGNSPQRRNSFFDTVDAVVEHVINAKTDSMTDKEFDALTAQVTEVFEAHKAIRLEKQLAKEELSAN